MGNQGLNFRSYIWPMNMNPRRSINDQNGDKEEEELKKQLSVLDLYEDGMTVDEMRQRLKFVDESKLEASFSSGNNSGSPSDVIESVISPTSPPVDNRKISNPPTKSISRESTSPEALDDLFRNKWSQQKDNDSADESLFGPSRPANVADAVRARKVPEESLNTHYLLSPSPNREVNVATRRNHSSQDMKTYFNANRISKSMDTFDVLDCKALPNDVPLKPRCPPKPRQKIQIVDGIPVIPDEISAQKFAYLTEMANLAHSWKTKLVCNEFSWGPPIKAGIDNGSLDKFPPQDELPDDPETPGQSCVITREVNAIGYSLRPTVKSTNPYHFPDSDDDFVDTSKRKKAPKILSNRTEISRQFQPKKNQIRGSSEETTTNVISLLEISDDKVEQTNSTPNGRKRTKSASPEYPEEVPTYPRRVVPPIPSTAPKSRRRTPASATRTKKRTASPEYNTDNNKPKRTASGLSEKEIEELISDDEEPKIVDSAVPPTKRLNQGVEYLKRARLATDEEKQKREREAKLIADQEAREKTERVQRRINERDEKKQQQETHEKSAKEREDRYRNLTSGIRSHGHVPGTFQKRTELESEGPRPRTLELPSNSMEIEIRATPDADESDMFADSGYETITAVEAVEHTVCPICGKNFSQVEIVNHAANCNDFVEDKPRDNVVNAIPSTSSRLSLPKKFTCNICEFTTQDENFYKHHFSQCVRSLTDEGSKSNKAASPIRSNRKLFLATHDSDDEIDQTESISSLSTDRKRTSKPQSRKKKF